MSDRISVFKLVSSIIFLISISMIMIGCSDEPSVVQHSEDLYAIYDENNGWLKAIGCSILHYGNVHKDSVQVSINDYVIIMKPDSSCYFYSPQQGDIPLSVQSSCEAFVSLLKREGYFGENFMRSSLPVETDVGINISGDVSSGELEFTNRLHRWAAVKIVDHNGNEVAKK